MYEVPKTQLLQLSLTVVLEGKKTILKLLFCHIWSKDVNPDCLNPERPLQLLIYWMLFLFSPGSVAFCINEELLIAAESFICLS